MKCLYVYFLIDQLEEFLFAVQRTAKAAVKEAGGDFGLLNGGPWFHMDYIPKVSAVSYGNHFNAVVIRLINSITGTILINA